MISYLKGVVLHRRPGYAIIHCGSVGFSVFTDLDTEINMAKCGEEQALFTSLQVRENELRLFGFDSLAKLETFDLLLNANKVGPKVALNFISALSVEQIIQAIIEKNHKKFGKISGVGAKTQQQVILDCQKGAEILAERHNISYQKNIAAEAPSEEPMTEIDSGVVEALQRLGFTNSEIRRSIKACQATKGYNMMTESQILSTCLRFFTTI